MSNPYRGPNVHTFGVIYSASLYEEKIIGIRV